VSPQPSPRDGEGIKEEDFDTILQNKCPIVPLHRTALAQEPNPLARHGNQLKEIAQHHHARVLSFSLSFSLFCLVFEYLLSRSENWYSWCG
jgi:hypothetical protein